MERRRQLVQRDRSPKPSYQTSSGVHASARPRTSRRSRTRTPASRSTTRQRRLDRRRRHERGVAVRRRLYALYGLGGDAPGWAYSHTADFYDVTTGKNGTCATALCNAGAGWDGPTGIGTPNGAKLVSYTARAMAENYAETLNQTLGGWNTAMGLRLTRGHAERCVGELTVGAIHTQPYGIVHGGVHAGIIEAACSTGAAIVALARGHRRRARELDVVLPRRARWRAARDRDAGDARPPYAGLARHRDRRRRSRARDRACAPLVSRSRRRPRR